MKRSSAFCLALGGLALLSTAAFAQEDLSGWGKFKAITINTSATGANTTAAVTNFPLLVRLDSTSADVFAQSKAGGADLRFRRKPGPQLAYKIVSWDSAARKAEIWVSVDSIYGNSATQTINMYWQKSSATAPTNGSAVFDTAKGFVAAWDLGGAAGARVNSAPGGVTARPMSANVDSTFTGRSVPGVVGFADSLRGGTATAGAQEYFDVSPMPSFPGGFTFSGWVNLTSVTGSWFRVFDFGNGEAADNIFLSRSASTNDWIFDLFPAFDAFATGALAAGQWQYLTATIGVFDETAGAWPTEIFVNGVSAGTGAAGSFPEVDRMSCLLGKSNWTDTFFPGKMDEIQVSKVSRSASWVKLSYETQKPGASALTFGASGTPTALAQAAQPAAQALQVRRQGTGFTFVLPAAADAEMRMTVTDMWGRAVWSNRIGKSDRTVAWNGKAANGAPLARGMYLARVVPVAGAKSGAVWEGKIAYTH